MHKLLTQLDTFFILKIIEPVDTIDMVKRRDSDV